MGQGKSHYHFSVHCSEISSTAGQGESGGEIRLFCHVCRVAADPIRIKADIGTSLRQYKTKISSWGLEKNVKTREMRFIVMKRQHRRLLETHKRELVFRVRKSRVRAEQIERFMDRKGISIDDLYRPSSPARKLKLKVPFAMKSDIRQLLPTR